jgi:hypothetical protein
MKGAYHPTTVMRPPMTMEEQVMLTRYAIVRMPDSSAVVPLMAWK